MEEMIFTPENENTDFDISADNTAPGEELSATTPKPVAEEPKVTVKYNHKERTLSLKDAADLIQKNMYAESSIEKLKFMASHKGLTLPELVNDIFEQNEKSEIAELKAKFEDDEDGFINALRDRRKSNEQAFLEMLKNEDEPDINRRLADEFMELSGEFPEIENITDLSDEVLHTAATTGKSLLLSFLLDKVKKESEIQKAKEKQAENANTSTNSFHSAEIAGEDPEIMAMLKGLAKN